MFTSKILRIHKKLKAFINLALLRLLRIFEAIKVLVLLYSFYRASVMSLLEEGGGKRTKYKGVLS